jgi:hypothetical protein
VPRTSSSRRDRRAQGELVGQETFPANPGKDCGPWRERGLNASRNAALGGGGRRRRHRVRPLAQRRAPSPAGESVVDVPPELSPRACGCSLNRQRPERTTAWGRATFTALLAALRNDRLSSIPPRGRSGRPRRNLETAHRETRGDLVSERPRALNRLLTYSSSWIQHGDGSLAVPQLLLATRRGRPPGRPLHLRRLFRAAPLPSNIRTPDHAPWATI